MMVTHVVVAGIALAQYAGLVWLLVAPAPPPMAFVAYVVVAGGLRTMLELQAAAQMATKVQEERE